MYAYRTVIAFDYPEVILDENGDPMYECGEQKIQYKTKYLPLDYQDEKSITANAHVVTQPLQNGDTMADHMYRDPLTVSVKGKFALNGRNWNNDSYGFVGDSDDRLTSIQYVFEYIKNSGILCTITTVETDMDQGDYTKYDNNGELQSNMNPSKTRFLTRENMALEGISWTEKQNVLEFNFNFKEVIMVDTQYYQVDASDLDLPSLNYPSVQSLGTLLFESGELPTAVTQILYSNGYIKDDFLRAVATEFGNTMILSAYMTVVAIGLGIVVATTASIIAGGVAATALAGGAAAIFPVGTIVVGAAMIIGGVVFGIKAIIENCEKAQKEKQAFKLINGSPTQDYRRYSNLMDDIISAVNVAGTNLSIFQFSSDENQTICLPIGGDFYYITITSLNQAPYFSADVRINSENKDQGDTVETFGNWEVVTDFTSLHENTNVWFKSKDRKYEVYLVNISLSDEVNPTEAGKTEVKKKLSTYSIWISQGHISEQINKISSSVEEAIIAHDFSVKH